MVKILIGVGLGFLLFTNPEARQITGDLLRSAGDAIAPAKEGKTIQNRMQDAVLEKVQEKI
ncbi:hypothetical protein [Synechococcus sp. WH 8016]|uniref:hypothetical protein n=1 Tax=Synechococcus sp. WH 8016 TaxID=166318 RepID=UPI00022D8EB7|nr:hypothetical protein [Synechococcus sp. WH 8016]EHA60127.1 hypothetical protein Syn8016DRAFT_2509 [Synechococcus sp. WH 8016]